MGELGRTGRDAAGPERVIRYEPQESPPGPLAFGLGCQQAALCIAGVVLTPVIVIQAAGGSDAYLTWAVFAALAVSGVTTVLQSVRVGRIGAGYPMLMGTSGAFIAVSVTALANGGPAMLATLVLVSALFQFVLAARLSWLRRIITPTVAGTVIMLIAVTVMPIVFGKLTDVPAAASPAAGPVSAGVTLAVITGLTLRATGTLRLWVPVVGLVIGCLVASFFGLYDLERVAQADWIGLPSGGWPGYDLSFSPTFWALLPAFVFVTLVGAIETIGDSVAVQGVSWRKPRATDYREVQGAVAADGMGNLLSGLAGTVPNTTYSTSVAILELTGVAARSVGVWIGVVFVAVAFLPKFAAVLVAIPGPVVAAYLLALLSLLFVLGMRMVVRDGVDYRKAIVVGVSFWVGVGFQNQAIFADHLGHWWGTLLGNGMTSGGLVAVLLTTFMQLTEGRRRRIETVLQRDTLPEVDAFLREFAARRGWGDEAEGRLRSAGEEALLSLIERQQVPEDGADEAAKRRLLLMIRGDGRAAEWEFVAAPGTGNLEDLMAVLSQSPQGPVEQELSLRLLRHRAASVQHRQYHSTDVLTVGVTGDSPRQQSDVGSAEQR